MPLATAFTLWPDENQWLSRLQCPWRRKKSLGDVMEELEYDGPPELFTMFLCLFGSLKVDLKWCVTHAASVFNTAQVYRSMHGLWPSPEKCLQLVGSL